MKNKKVFIVHGRDDVFRDEVKAYLEQLGWEPVVLAEQASLGATIIEKIEDYADVRCAVVLYTGCDVGALKGELTMRPRARQNVVLEHGFFIGRLGRKCVFAIKDEAVEAPNDLAGVVYISRSRDWRTELGRELSALPAQRAPRRKAPKASQPAVPSAKALSSVLESNQWSHHSLTLDVKLKSFIADVQALASGWHGRVYLREQRYAWASQHAARQLYHQFKDALNSEEVLAAQSTPALLLLYASAIASGKKRGYAALERLVRRKYRTRENASVFDAWVQFLHRLPPEGEMNHKSISSFDDDLEATLVALLTGEGKPLPAGFSTTRMFEGFIDSDAPSRWWFGER